MQLPIEWLPAGAPRHTTVLIDRCLHRLHHLYRLTHHIPLRTSQAALGAMPMGASGVE